jgi:hypothetical protein
LKLKKTWYASWKIDVDGKMERWKDGKMERWKDGKMERWKDGKTCRDVRRATALHADGSVLVICR